MTKTLPIAEKIRIARQRRNWKSVELAKRAGVSPSILSAIEGGYGQSKPALVKICKALGLEVPE